jgi:hypothetical protein
MAINFTEEADNQRLQLCKLYEQKESLDKNIEGVKQIIATLEYAADRVKTDKQPQQPQQSTKGK